MENMINKVYSFMGIYAILQSLLPRSTQEWLSTNLDLLWKWLLSGCDRFVELEVDEKSNMGGNNLSTHRGNRHINNALYKDACTYLSPLISESADTLLRLKVGRPAAGGGGGADDGDDDEKEKVWEVSDRPFDLSFALPEDETVHDTFRGISVSWRHTSATQSSHGHGHGGARGHYTFPELLAPQSSFTLRFPHKHRAAIVPAYLHHVSEVASDIRHKSSQLHIHTNIYDSWDRCPFNHPSTFDTLALPDSLSARVLEDLRFFSSNKQYFHRNGRAWKRGYLLYGPPGTGKSSMIAAIANHLHFDIYDLELSNVESNTELKSLLMRTTPKSIIIVEDIDCTVSLCKRSDGPQTSLSCNEQEVSDVLTPTGCGVESMSMCGPDATSAKKESGKITLSGFLNFVDGLWSCYAEERIFIFTTNHKDKLDPALLRPGRMDMHILLSYCTFPVVKKLSMSYLHLPQDHVLLQEIEHTMATTPNLAITPAMVSELLISNQNDPDTALQLVLSSIQKLSSSSTHFMEESLNKT